MLSLTCLTKIPSRILTVGQWNQMILDSSGKALKSLRLGVMSCSRKLSTGAINSYDIRLNILRKIEGLASQGEL